MGTKSPIERDFSRQAARTRPGRDYARWGSGASMRPDSAYAYLDESLREVLTVGRPIERGGT